MSNATRGFPVEDTAAMVLRFAGGALGTFLLSDAAGSVRSWEQTARENADYPTYPDEDAYLIAGTAGSGRRFRPASAYPGEAGEAAPADAGPPHRHEHDP